MTKKRISSKVKITLVLLINLFIASIVAVVISILMNAHITVACYSVDSAGAFPADGIRIVLMSDLHRRKFDETNQQLVDRTAKQQPDIICVGGDMLERDCTVEEVEALASLLSRLMEIAPVYCSYGNHDYAVLAQLNAEIDPTAGENAKSITPIRARLEETGARFFEEEYLDIDINGKSVRIGGMFGYAFNTGSESDETNWQQQSEYRFLTKFCDTDSYKILMCHRPDSFIFSSSAWEWDIDLVLSGHTHNGVIALPFLGAVIAPDQGLFPKYDRGKFELCNITMIISGGLDGYGWVPRVFNPPEIVSIDIN